LPDLSLPSHGCSPLVPPLLPSPCSVFCLPSSWYSPCCVPNYFSVTTNTLHQKVETCIMINKIQSKLGRFH
jgi:hypothetical protein